MTAPTPQLRHDAIMGAVMGMLSSRSDARRDREIQLLLTADSSLSLKEAEGIVDREEGL